MKHFILNTNTCIALLMGMVVFTNCKRELDVESEPDYNYSIELMPVVNSIQKNETVALQFSVNYTGYEGATFKFRYFQPEGQGRISDDAATVYEMNKEYMFPANGTIKLFYTSDCEIPQKLDFVFTDKFGVQKEHTVQFNAVSGPDYGFSVGMDPVKEALHNGESTELKFTITCNESYEGATYTFRYSQVEGSGQLLFPGKGAVNMHQDYSISPEGTVNLSYTANGYIHHKLVFVFEDLLGYRVECPVEFDDMTRPYFGIKLPSTTVKLPSSGSAELNFTITDMEKYDTRDFKFCYSQTLGGGALSDSKGAIITKGQFYPVPDNGLFTLRYLPKGGSRSHRLEFTVEDSYGNQEKVVVDLN